MSEKKQIIKDAFKLTFARYCSQGVGFFTSIAMRRFLGPFYIGIWSLLKIIVDYAEYLLLGVNQGVCYQIPFLIGKNKKHEEEAITDEAFSFIYLVSILTAAVLLIATIILRNKYPIEVIIGLLALSAYILLDRICNYYMLLLRARNNFSVLSKSIVFDAVINLILIFLLVKNFKIYGLYITVILMAVFNTVFIHFLARYRVNFHFKFKGIWGLMKIGFPITILGFLDGILLTVDRIMIGKMIGVTFVGFYSVSIMTKSYINQLSSFGTVLYPRLMQAYGKNESIEEIKKYAIIPQKVNAYTLPLVLGLIFFIAPLLIRMVLPKFIPGILAIQILLIDMFFRSCSPQSMHFIIAIKKQARAIPITVAAIILNVLGNYILIKKGYGIYGVAWATSIVTFLVFLSLQTYAMLHFARIKEIIKFFIEIIFPFMYTAAVVLLLEHYVRLQNVFISMILKCFLLFCASLPLLAYINKKTHIIRLVLNIIQENILSKFKIIKR